MLLKRLIVLPIVFLSLLLIGCEKKCYLSIHYTNNEKEDIIIELSKSNVSSIQLEDINLEGYEFLGYFEGNNKIEKITEVRDYHLETRYKELEYIINIDYQGITHDKDTIVFTKSSLNNLDWPSFQVENKVFLGLFDNETQVNDFTILKNYNLTAKFIDESIEPLFLQLILPNCLTDFSIKNIDSQILEASIGNNDIVIETYLTENIDPRYLESTWYSYTNNLYQTYSDYDLFKSLYFTTNKVLETNFIQNADCVYSERINIIYDLYDKQNHSIESILNQGDVIQFVTCNSPIDNFDGEYIMLNNIKVSVDHLNKYLCYVNSVKLKETVKNVLNVNSEYKNYIENNPYNLISVVVEFIFNISTDNLSNEYRLWTMIYVSCDNH